ncbi:hypothetical protein V5F72_23850 [Xanthobacter flavus]|uniref:hypothetical protein n=1 Tax=Xanthobacter flavus TaxID=281 RepID=UPI003728D1CB
MRWPYAEAMIRDEAGPTMKPPSEFERAREALVVAVLIIVSVFISVFILLALPARAPAQPMLPAFEETSS